MIEDLIRQGVSDGIWEKGFVPAGAKNGLFEYLRDKAKNKQKKKLLDEATNEFVQEYGDL